MWTQGNVVITREDLVRVGSLLELHGRARRTGPSCNLHLYVRTSEESEVRYLKGLFGGRIRRYAKSPQWGWCTSYDEAATVLRMALPFTHATKAALEKALWNRHDTPFAEEPAPPVMARRASIASPLTRDYWISSSQILDALRAVGAHMTPSRLRQRIEGAPSKKSERGKPTNRVPHKKLEGTLWVRRSVYDRRWPGVPLRRTAPTT